jgi:hypothetical protein
MNKRELLIIGQSNTSFQTFNDQFTKNGNWSVITASSDEEAIEKFHRHLFEVVVLTDTVSSDEEKKLQKIFSFHNPDIIIVKDQNGNNEALVAEIEAGLDKLKNTRKPSYSLVDDALKNAGLNITIE